MWKALELLFRVVNFEGLNLCGLESYVNFVRLYFLSIV